MNNLTYEKNLNLKNEIYIAGIDEVGRGPLAGPLVVAAVILDLEKILKLDRDLNMINDVESRENYSEYTQITDSKKISDKKRRELAGFIKMEALSYSIIEISNIELDKIGLAEATQVAFYTSVKKLKIKPQHILTDMFKIKKISPETQTNIVKGDSLSISIGAASIIAKVYRDDLMLKYHEKHPEYGFDKHKGYGTKTHIEAINKYGVCEIHRRSFDPLKSQLKNAKGV